MLPLKLIVVELPEHIGLVAALAVPPTDVGLTIIAPLTALVADPQVPVTTT